MDKYTKKNVIGIVAGSIVSVAAIGGFVMALPSVTRLWNNYWHNVQEADDETNYRTKKMVEDTCRAMISSYTMDKITYENYKDSDDKTHQLWAEQAKIRANRTAVSYNEYILKNNYVWKDDVPEDIKHRLEPLD